MLVNYPKDEMERNLQTVVTQVIPAKFLGTVSEFVFPFIVSLFLKCQEFVNSESQSTSVSNIQCEIYNCIRGFWVIPVLLKSFTYSFVVRL